MSSKYYIEFCSVRGTTFSPSGIIRPDEAMPDSLGELAAEVHRRIRNQWGEADEPVYRIRDNVIGPVLAEIRWGGISLAGEATPMNVRYVIAYPKINRVDEFLFETYEDARHTAEELERAPFKIVGVWL